MSAEFAQPMQKVLVYQEAGQALRALEQARRTAFTFFAASTFAILGFIYSRTVQADTCAYLSLAGILLSSTSFHLFMKYSKAMKRTREQLLTLQNVIGESVYSSSALAGSSERNFYVTIHTLVGVIFIITSVFFIRDASARNHLIFQSCGPYVEIAAEDIAKACPCGRYPPPTDIQGACPTRSTSDEKIRSLICQPLEF